jgi:hypothetical protein
MNKLWVYGCSFCEPFGILQGMDWTNDGLRDLHGVDYWGTHLAKKLNLSCNTVSLSGIGWNYINDFIDRDFEIWDKEDIIVINPSFFTRTSIREFKDYSLSHAMNKLIDEWILLDDIHLLNETRWVNKLKSLQKHYNVYTWVVDDILFHSVDNIKNLIKAEGHVNWKHWLDLNKQYWTDPTTKIYPLGDWHFNKAGHIRAAELMCEIISNDR